MELLISYTALTNYAAIATRQPWLCPEFIACQESFFFSKMAAINLEGSTWVKA